MDYGATKIRKEEDITLVKMELTLKKSIPINTLDFSTDNIEVISGFLVGVSHRLVAVETCEICEQYIVLTKDFKKFTICNMRYFYIMSIMYKSSTVETLHIAKTDKKDQTEAFDLLNYIMGNLKENKKTEEDQDIVNLSCYDINDMDLLFVDEDEILSNIDLTRKELQEKASKVIRPDYGINTPYYNGTKTPYYNGAPAWPKPHNATPTVPTKTCVKEPMFFKRTKTRPSKKLVDKLREMTILISENGLSDPYLEKTTEVVKEENVCIACEGSGLNSKGSVCRICDGSGKKNKTTFEETGVDDADYDDSSFISGCFGM